MEGFLFLFLDGRHYSVFRDPSSKEGKADVVGESTITRLLFLSEL